MDEVQCVICQVKAPGWSMECGSGALEACDGLVDQAEGDLASDEADGATVWLVVFFSGMRNVSFLNVTMADGSQPPLVDRTKGMKVPCSTSRTHC